MIFQKKVKMEALKKHALPVDYPLIPLRRAEVGSFAVRVAVDLSIMRPSGENGGIKVFVYEYIKQLVSMHGNEIVFIYLTWSKTRGDVRLLARPIDEIVCVRSDGNGDMLKSIDWRNNEMLWLNPPVDFLHRLRVDVLYSPQPSIEFATPGIPMVATVVDVLHRDYPATLAAQEIAQREKIHQDLVKCANYFQCISNHTAERLRLHYAIPAERTFRTYIPVGHRLNSDLNLQDSMPLPKSYFLYPANGWKHKNHKTLLVAFALYRAKVSASTSGWDLVLTGHDDESMREILKDAETLGVGKRVHYLGHLSTDKFAQVWKRAGALVFPSLHEGFGIPLVEAMHFGKPILASSEGSLPEVGEDAALFADCRKPEVLATALERISKDQALREQLIACGKKRLGQFSIEHEARIFWEMLNKSAKSRPLLWIKGYYADGWTDPLAIASLPTEDSGGAARLYIRFAPMPLSRHIRLYIDGYAQGGYVVPAGITWDLTIGYDAGGRYLCIEVVDASNLNPEDHRTHGVLISKIQSISKDGKIVSILDKQT